MATPKADSFLPFAFAFISITSTKSSFAFGVHDARRYVLNHSNGAIDGK